MGPFDYKATLIILHSSLQLSTCSVVLLITHLHDLKFYTSSANPTLLCTCFQSRGALLGWDVETEGHTLTDSSVILQKLVIITATVCSHEVIIFLNLSVFHTLTHSLQ